MDKLIFFLYNIIGLVVGMLIYRYGFIEGQRVSKGLPINSIVNKKESKKIELDKDPIIEGWDNIMAYTGEPQKGSKEE
jgi:hypothetical protein